MSTSSTTELAAATSEIVAVHIDQKVGLDAARPSSLWERAQPITFHKDWQGANPDPERQTKVKLLWSQETLYLRFECCYRGIFVFEDADPDGRCDHLWERDVAEVFLQSDPSLPDHYKEFEVSPNGMWIDLDIAPGGRANLKSGLRCSAFIDAKRHTWAAELAIPMEALTSDFDPNSSWRANFFRMERAKEKRTFLAWQPTLTPQPNFHVSEVFGQLRFAPR